MSGIRGNNGWLEAAIAWEVCASLHRQYCKGKDALFTTRQSDFVKHAEDAREYASRGQAPAKVSYEKDLEGALRERDDADDFIDALLDEVLGTERAEWSSAYGRANALEEVRERITALHKPAVDRAWARFEAPMAQPAPAETMTLQEVWNAAGGNPGIKPTRDDVLLALKMLDEVCDEVGRAKAPAGAASVTDAMVLAALQVQYPAGYGTQLRHPANGPKTSARTEAEIDLARRMIAAALATRGQAPAQAAPAYKDSTPDMHVGDSAFESWYSAYNPSHKSDKQRARDAYAAGMVNHKAQAIPGVQWQCGPQASGFTAPQADSVTAPAATCPTCKAPCTTTVNMRGGEHGWGTTDLERTVYHYAPTQAADSVLEDAARYRWLREQSFDTWKLIAWNTWNNDPAVWSDRDAAIDAARKQGGA